MRTWVWIVVGCVAGLSATAVACDDREAAPAAGGGIAGSGGVAGASGSVASAGTGQGGVGAAGQGAGASAAGMGGTVAAGGAAPAGASGAAQGGGGAGGGGGATGGAPGGQGGAPAAGGGGAGAGGAGAAGASGASNGCIVAPELDLPPDAPWCVTGKFTEGLPPILSPGTVQRRKFPTKDDPTFGWAAESVVGFPGAATAVDTNAGGSWMTALTHSPETTWLIHAGAVTDSTSVVIQDHRVFEVGGTPYLAYVAPKPADPGVRGLWIWPLCGGHFTSGPGCEPRYVPTPAEYDGQVAHRIVVVGDVLILQRDGGFQSPFGGVTAETFAIVLSDLAATTNPTVASLGQHQPYACGTAGGEPELGGEPGLLWLPSCQVQQFWNTAPFVLSFQLPGPTVKPIAVGLGAPQPVSDQSAEGDGKGALYVGRGTALKTVLRLERKSALAK